MAALKIPAGGEGGWEVAPPFWSQGLLGAWCASISS